MALLLRNAPSIPWCPSCNQNELGHRLSPRAEGAGHMRAIEADGSRILGVLVGSPDFGDIPVLPVRRRPLLRGIGPEKKLQNILNIGNADALLDLPRNTTRYFLGYIVISIKDIESEEQSSLVSIFEVVGGVSDVVREIHDLALYDAQCGSTAYLEISLDPVDH